MQKKSFMNELFEERTSKDSQSSRTKNVSKFIQCFNVVSNNRSRQIRILQIGPSGVNNMNKKPFLTTQPLKKPPIGLFYNQVLFPTNSLSRQLTSKGLDSKANLFQSSPTKTNHSKTISPQKSIFMAATQFVINTSPKKTRGWASRKKKVEELPKEFCKRASQNSAQGSKEQDHIDDIVSKSVNLLNKIKVVQQYPNLHKQIKNINTNVNMIHHKPKIKVQLNRKTPQEIAEEQRRAKLQIKRQISHDYAKPFNPPINITAQSYIIFEPKFSDNKGRKKKYFQESQLSQVKESKRKYPHSHKVIASFNSRNSMQIASLTKIMTCIVALQISEKYKLNSKQQKILIGKFQSNIGGTSAQICEGQTYTLQDLYYGLMLPSGNDASVAIAVWGGRILLSKQNDEMLTHKKKQFYQRFIVEMNMKAKQLGMIKTNYANSHGLVNPENRSCAFDLALLCEHAMQNGKFKQIVSCKLYRNTIEYYTSENNSMAFSTKKSAKDLMISKEKEKDDQIQEGQQKDLDSNEQENQQRLKLQTSIGVKTIQWENTHRLVQQKSKQYIGIKTGITTAAGPCLASCVKCENGRYFIIIVLNCDKLSMRFKDTENLKKWVLQRQGMSSPRKRQQNVLDHRQQQPVSPLFP